MFDNLSNYLTASGLGIAGTIIAVWIRKMFSQASVEITRDKAEVDVIVTLQNQVGALQARLSQTEAENYKLSIDLARIQARLSEYESYKTQSETLSRKIEEKDVKYETYLRDSTEMIANLKSKLSEKDLKIQSLEQESKSLQARVDHLESLFQIQIKESVSNSQ